MFTKSLKNRQFFTVKTYTNSPKSDWETPQKLKNDAGYCYNISSCEGKQPHPHYIETKFIMYVKNKNPSAIFDDMIIARHKNLKDQFDNQEFISFMFATRTPVSKQVLEFFLKAKERPRLQLNLMDDARIRLGITTTCVNEKDKTLLLNTLEIIHNLSPIPEVFFNALPSILAEKFVVTETLNAIPVNTSLIPTYFKMDYYTLRYGGYSYAHYKEDDSVIESEITPIHLAVLNNEYELAKEILNQNPELANKKDPWGVSAHQLALSLGPLHMFELFVTARKQCQSYSASDTEQKKRDDFILHTWSETGHNAVIAFNLPRELAELKFADNKKTYQTLIESPKPIRSIFHLACIHGDMETIKNILELQPERLNEQDIRGYTPILLAAANGHAHIVRWLLAKGASYELASHKRNLSGTYTHCLIDNASTPEVLQAILKFTTNQKTLKQKLVSAIETNDVRMALRLADYLKGDFNYKGLSALDLALKLSGKNGIELVENLLMLHDELMPQGPYDTDLQTFIESYIPIKIEDPLISNMDARIPTLLEKHNKKIMGRRIKKMQRIKLHNEYNETNEDSIQLISEFHSEDLTIQSVFKRIVDLDDIERKKLHELFFCNFEMLYENTQENQQKYLEKALSEEQDKPAFINLFYDKETLVAFMTFELIRIENAVIFHGKLTGNLPDEKYTSQRLISIAFRAMCAVKLLTPKDKKVYVYVKAIHPGLGLCALMPALEPDYFPKHQNSISESFVKKIVEATDETMVNGKILAKLRLTNERPIDTKNPVLRFFSEETGGDFKDALPVCYEITEDVMKQYIESYKYHHVDSLSLRNFALLWSEFSEAKSEYIYCQKAKL